MNPLPVFGSTSSRRDFPPVQSRKRMFLNPPCEAVPSLKRLAHERTSQLRTSTFSTTKPGLSLLRTMPSSSASISQSSTSTFRASMSTPSLLWFAWLSTFTLRKTTPSQALK